MSISARSAAGGLTEAPEEYEWCCHLVQASKAFPLESKAICKARSKNGWAKHISWAAWPADRETHGLANPLPILSCWLVVGIPGTSGRRPFQCVHWSPDVPGDLCRVHRIYTGHQGHKIFAAHLGPAIHQYFCSDLVASADERKRMCREVTGHWKKRGPSSSFDGRRVPCCAEPLKLPFRKELPYKTI